MSWLKIATAAPSRKHCRRSMKPAGETDGDVNCEMRRNSDAGAGFGSRPCRCNLMVRAGQAVLPTVARALLLRFAHAVSQISPGLRHPQEEKLAHGIRQACGDFHAIGGVQPVTGDVFPTTQDFPDHQPLRLLTSPQVASCGIVPSHAFGMAEDFCSRGVSNAEIPRLFGTFSRSWRLCSSRK
ncbi:MAG TPA: hypothetical protein VMA30_10235 [Xanthobacteraceae bacterium]|nr:hypothetical protein [Xanthobacteraceae bacterium]